MSSSTSGEQDQKDSAHQVNEVLLSAYWETVMSFRHQLDDAHDDIGTLKDKISTMEETITWLKDSNMQLQEKCDRVDGQRYDLEQKLYVMKDAVQEKIGKLESIVVKLQLTVLEMDNESARRSGGPERRTGVLVRCNGAEDTPPCDP